MNVFTMLSMLILGLHGMICAQEQIKESNLPSMEKMRSELEQKWVKENFSIRLYLKAMLLGKIAAKHPKTAIRSVMSERLFAKWEELLGELYVQDDSACFADFFETALLLPGSCNKEIGIMAYFNPWSDLMLLVQIDMSSAKLQIEDFAVIRGNQIRKSSNGKVDYETSGSIYWRLSEDTILAYYSLFQKIEPLGSVLEGQSWIRKEGASDFVMGLQKRFLSQMALLGDAKDAAGKDRVNISRETWKVLQRIMWAKELQTEIAGAKLDEIGQTVLGLFLQLHKDLRMTFQLADYMSSKSVEIWSFASPAYPYLAMVFTIPLDKKQQATCEFINLRQNIESRQGQFDVLMEKIRGDGK